MKRILLFDSNIEGHHADYLAHLINYWSVNQVMGELLLATDARFANKYMQITGSSWASNVKLVPLEQQVVEAIEQLSPIKRSFAEWALAKKQVEIHKPDALVLMYFDIFQLAISLERNFSCEVSGIYFRPNFHYEIHGFKQKLNQLMKKQMIKKALSKGFVKQLFSLDSSAVDVAKQMGFGKKMQTISDPVKIYPISTTEMEEARRFYKIPENKQVFLLFGYLDDRKGILQLLAALEQVPSALLQKAVFLLVGPTSEAFGLEIEEKIQKIANNATVLTYLQEIRGKSIQVLFEISSYILALYQQHIGMSSIIVRAAVSGKPLISSDYGFMGKMVKERHLGIVLNATIPAEIAKNIEKVLLEGITFSAENLEKVANENSDIHFAKMIFGE